MQSYIVLGEKEERDRFIASFIKEQKIKTYNILLLETKVKIADVRGIKAHLSIKQAIGEKKLVILNSEITDEAQNALLKVLEELPDFVDVIISSSIKHNFLPTVVSRCRIISLFKEKVQDKEIEGLEKKIKEYTEGKDFIDLGQVMLFSQCLLQLCDGKADKLQKLIRALRNLMVESALETKNKRVTINFYRIISNINQLYPLIINNNLNLKYSLDKALLDAFALS